MQVAVEEQWEGRSVPLLPSQFRDRLLQLAFNMCQLGTERIQVQADASVLGAESIKLEIKGLSRSYRFDEADSRFPR